MTANDFKENIFDQCIYMKVSRSKYIFLVLYVDDILLATDDTDLLVETKQFLFNYFDMKDLGKHLMSLAYRYFAIDLVAL